MNPDHAFFAEWDAAYVLGALSSADRRAYEAHLDECAICRRATAELTPTVGLLSRVSPERAERIHEGEEARDADAGQGRGLDDDAVRAGIASLTRARRRRRRTWWAVGVAAALALVVGIGVPIAVSSLTPRPTAEFVLEDVAGVPIEASVRLTSVAWGTRIDLECSYPESDAGDAPADGWVYVLAVVGADGTDDPVSTWRAGPGSSARLSAGTAMDLDSISAIEVRASDGTVLMRYDDVVAG